VAVGFQKNSPLLVPFFSNKSPVPYTYLLWIFLCSSDVPVSLFLPFLQALRVRPNRLILHDFTHFTIFSFSKDCSISLLFRILRLPAGLIVSLLNESIVTGKFRGWRGRGEVTVRFDEATQSGMKTDGNAFRYSYGTRSIARNRGGLLRAGRVDTTSIILHRWTRRGRKYRARETA